MSERVQSMARLYVEEGMSYQQIAEQFGITRQRVGQLLGPLKLYPNRATRRRSERIQGLHAAHRRIMSGESTPSQEAEKLGYASEGVLRSAFSEEGLMIRGRPRPIPEHGTLARYRRGCVCDACREANREASTKRRQRGEPPKHGTASAYFNYGCLCQACRDAGRRARRNRKAQKRRMKEVRT